MTLWINSICQAHFERWLPHLLRLISSRMWKSAGTKPQGIVRTVHKTGAQGEFLRALKAYWSVRKYFITASSAIRLPMVVPTSPELR